MKLRKLPYYLHSLYLLTRELKNPHMMFLPWIGFPALLQFKNGLRIKVLRPLDLLIAKETIIDDCYRLRTLQAPKRILDIGASVGDFSILATSLHPEVLVHCFEPHHTYFHVLEENIKSNASTRVTAYSYAIGNSERRKSLNEFLGEEIDLLKIDCEGAEHEILSDIQPERLQRIKLLALEYHRDTLGNMDELLESLLSANGFACEKIPDPYNTKIGYLFARRNS